MIAPRRIEFATSIKIRHLLKHYRDIASIHKNRTVSYSKAVSDLVELGYILWLSKKEKSKDEIEKEILEFLSK